MAGLNLFAMSNTILGNKSKKLPSLTKQGGFGDR
jgi:hypothetical protein